MTEWIAAAVGASVALGVLIVIAAFRFVSLRVRIARLTVDLAAARHELDRERVARETLTDQLQAFRRELRTGAPEWGDRSTVIRRRT